MIFVRIKNRGRWHIQVESGTLCGRTPTGIDPTRADSPAQGTICDKCNRGVMGETKGESEKKRLERQVFIDLTNCQLTDGLKQQHKFKPGRKWAFDFAYPRYRIAIEVNGGTYQRGAHSRGPRQRKDYEKWSEAAILGWMVVLVDAKDVSKKIHIERLQRAIEARTNRSQE